MLIVFGVAAAAVLVVFFYMLPRRPVAAQNQQRERVPPFYATVSSVSALPATLDPGSFQGPRVRDAYAIAKKKPAVLAQQPCYCGCDRQGHRSLLECFKDKHAEGCSICIREANYSNTMDAQGKCAAEIRTGIIRGDWKSPRF